MQIKFMVKLRNRYPDKIPSGKNPPGKNPTGKNPSEKIALNAVEREHVLTRVLKPNASEASYKPKQRSYRKTKLIFFSGGFLPRTPGYQWYTITIIAIKC